MQRRAVAVSAAIFLVIAAGAYAYIGAAQQPSVDVPAAHTLQNGDTLTAGGTEYTADVSGGSGKLTWVNQSERFTADLGNGSALTLVNDSYGYTPEAPENATVQGTYAVVVPNETNVSSFSLVEQQNVTAILAADDDVEDATVTRNGTEYVVYTNQTIRPLSAYLPEPDRRGPYAVGDSVTYQGSDRTVAAVTGDGATLEWFAPQEHSVTAADGANVTVGGTNYLALFPNNDTLVLSTAHQNYQNDLARQEYFHERMNGLWGVSILSVIAAVLLIAVGFLPSRY